MQSKIPAIAISLSIKSFLVDFKLGHSEWLIQEIIFSIQNFLNTVTNILTNGGEKGYGHKSTASCPCLKRFVQFFGFLLVNAAAIIIFI